MLLMWGPNPPMIRRDFSFFNSLPDVGGAADIGRVRVRGTSWSGKMPSAEEGRLGCEDLKHTGFFWKVLDFLMV